MGVLIELFSERMMKLLLLAYVIAFVSSRAEGVKDEKREGADYSGSMNITGRDYSNRDDSCYFGAITVGNWCCSTRNKCGIGGGDCDADNECETGLICGHNNCREFNRKADEGADCCTKRYTSCYKGETNWSCCSSVNKCKLGGGDCDSDDDCKPGFFLWNAELQEVQQKSKQKSKLL